MSYDFLSVYPAKALEYALAIGYLVLFVFFWRYVQGGRPSGAPGRGARPGAGRRPAGSSSRPACTSTPATPGRGSSRTGW